MTRCVGKQLFSVESFPPYQPTLTHSIPFWLSHLQRTHDHQAPPTRDPTANHPPSVRASQWQDNVAAAQRAIAKELADLAATLAGLCPQPLDVQSASARQPWDGVLCTLRDGQYASAALRSLPGDVLLQWAPAPLAVAFAEVLTCSVMCTQFVDYTTRFM